MKDSPDIVLVVFINYSNRKTMQIFIYIYQYNKAKIMNSYASIAMNPRINVEC